MSASSRCRLITFLLLTLAAGPGAGVTGIARWEGAQDDRRALEPGKPVERTIAPGETQSYSMTLAQGEFVHVFIHQRSVNVAAKLLAPDGSTRLDADSPLSTQESDWITHVAAVPGTYGIDVRAVDKRAPPGRYEIKIEERRKSVAGDDIRLSAQRAFADGMRAIGEKNLRGAIDKYQEALALYRQSGRRVEQAVTINSSGRSSVSLNDYQTAIARHREALVMYRELGDVHGEGYTAHELGNASFAISRFDEAIGYFEQALEARRTAGFRAGEANTLRNLASAYSASSRQEKAIEYYEQALAIARAEKFRSEEARTLSNLGIATSLLGRQEKAIEYFEQALAVNRELKDRIAEASMLGNLGLVNRNLSRFDQAIPYYEQQLAIGRELGDKGNEALALNNLGHVYISLSQYQKALDHFERSLATFRELKNRLGEGNGLANLGNTYFWLSAYDKSIEYSEQALAIFRDIKTRAEEGRTLNNLGDAYNVLGKYDRAMEYYEQSLAIARAIKNPVGEARALNSLGLVYQARGDYDRTIAYHEGALAIFRQVKDQADEGATLVSLGEAHSAQGRNDRAIDYYQQALAIVRSVRNRTGEGITLNDLMLAWKQQGNGRMAIVYGKAAVNAFQGVRGNLRDLDRTFQQSYVKAHEDTYRTLADLLISLGRLAEAEKVLELLKEEEFNRVVRRAAANTPTIGLTTTEAEAATIADRLASLAIERGPLLGKVADKTATDQDRQRLDAIESAITEANKQIKLVLAEVAKSAPDDTLVTQQSQSMMQSLRRLGQGTVALYTVITSQKSWVILTTPDFRRAYPIDTTDLNKTISDFRQTLRSDRYDPVPLARKLYDAIFRQKNERGTTLAADLESYRARTLMWSLDGVLRYVPISALHDGKEYLADRYPNLVFTTASLTRLLDPTQGNWRAFGLGVSKEYAGFPPLPAVPRELHAIIRETTAAKPQGVLPGVIRLDEQFTRKAMIDGLREGYPVVHIASHFRFNAEREETSFLLLGDGSYLSLEEMQNSPGIFERVELLTLSACDTATSGANGKEVEGMAYVAQDLGAKAVVASLWPVADIGTEVLMREFYRLRLAHAGWSKAEALRQAQMALLHGRQSGGTPVSGDNAIAGAEGTPTDR